MSIGPVRAFTLGLAVIAGAATAATPTPQTDLAVGQLAAAAIPFTACVPGGPTSGDTAIADQLRPAMNGPRLGRSLTAYSISCARAIVQTTRARGLDQRAAVIAVTTAITESSLHNYTQPVDHDSLGLFQQRPSQGWGTPSQLIDPGYATNAFLNAMLRKYPGNRWMTGDIGAICQQVQGSADPGAYALEVHDAQLITGALWAGHPDLGVLDFYLSDDPQSHVQTRPVVHYGNSPMVPIVGDWDGDGADTVSAYDPTSGRFYLSSNPVTGTAQINIMYGNPGAKPLVGDWDGDGKDNIGVRMGNTFYLRTTPVDQPAETTATVAYGDPGDTPVVGDWDGDGKDNVGVYRPGLFRFYLRMNPNTSTGETTRVVPYGNPNADPLIGDWDGDGKDNVGVRMGNTFAFRTSPVSSDTETTTSDAYGNGAGEIPIVGDWNADNKDTQGIVR
jgi:hypothetical protein